MNKKASLASIPLITLLTACGGGGSSEGEPEPKAAPQAGVFLDSPVINIGYRTETLSGETNSQGEYQYLAGESVTFFIGDLEFPATQAKGVLTPLDLANAQEVTDIKVVNMVRLLQTLDKDGNPDNGISISDAAKAAATQVDFSSQNFESLASVTNLIANGGQDNQVNELVSESDALAHFEAQLEENGIGEIEYYQVKLDLPNPFSSLSKVVLNDGAISFEELYTSDAEPLETGSTTYSITNDGRVTIAGVNTAAKNTNGSVMVGVDTDTEDGDVGLSIFTKLDTDVTVSDLGSRFYCASLDREPYSVFYEMLFYGNGTGIYTLIQDSAGSSGTDSFTYSVDQGMLTITGTNTSMKGGITNDASVITLSEFSDTSDEGMTICVMASTQANNATLSGTYYGAQLDSEPYSAFNTISFDGNGTATLSELSISGDEPSTDVELDYSVSRNGRITLAGSVLGAISLDGSVVIYTNTDSSGDLSLGVFVQ